MRTMTTATSHFQSTFRRKMAQRETAVLRVASGSLVPAACTGIVSRMPRHVKAYLGKYLVNNFCEQVWDV